MPQDPSASARTSKASSRSREREAAASGFRDVPVDNSWLSTAPHIAASEPVHRQVFIGRSRTTWTKTTRAPALHPAQGRLRRDHAETQGVDNGFYTVSMSSRTIVYKGMFLAYQLGAYYADLHDPRFESAVALVHQRFSTNTFPSWKLAHPTGWSPTMARSTRCAATSTGWRRRQASVYRSSSARHLQAVADLLRGRSEPACFDSALDPWHGWLPAVARDDDAHSRSVGGQPALGRTRPSTSTRGADGAVGRPRRVASPTAAGSARRSTRRPAATRYIVTNDGSSSWRRSRCLPVPKKTIVAKWRLPAPARCCSSTSKPARCIADAELKHQIVTRHPYRTGSEHADLLETCRRSSSRVAQVSRCSIASRRSATPRRTRVLIAPMATTGQEPSSRSAPTRGLGDVEQFELLYTTGGAG